MLSEHVKHKAREYVALGAVLQDAKDDSVWWVQPRDPTAKPYRVALVIQGDDVVSRSCTCRHGQASLGGAKCSHVVAALIRVKKSKSDEESR